MHFYSPGIMKGWLCPWQEPQLINVNLHYKKKKQTNPCSPNLIPETTNREQPVEASGSCRLKDLIKLEKPVSCRFEAANPPLQYKWSLNCTVTVTKLYSDGHNLLQISQPQFTRFFYSACSYQWCIINDNMWQNLTKQGFHTHLIFWR